MTDASEGQSESTWARLARRKVVQWGLAYAAGAWGFLQGLEYVVESFNWPQQFRQVALLALLIGLPVVLVLAWYHGDRGEQRVTRTELAILTLLFLLGGGLFWRYQQASETTPPVATAAKPAPATALPAAVAVPDAKSIAVLPFADMSAEKNQEYMSDGMAEELLNLLAQVPDLKVIARTSSFSFKGKEVDVATIAKTLNVANVLEGSVRKSGDTLRITAQLIRASDSAHLWSGRYDRPLDDIFAVQDEIAGAIVQALQIRLAGGEVLRRKGGTQNFEAYRLYLQAWNGEDWSSESSLNSAGELLERATELDRGFGIAWSALAGVYREKAANGFLDATEAFKQARQLIQHALQLSPDSALAHSTLQSIHLVYDWDWAAAESEGQQALALDPIDSSILNTAARLSLALGRWDEAERRLRAALSRDPLNPWLTLNLGITYYNSGRLAEAEGLFRSLLETSPGFTLTPGVLAATLLAQGRPEAALAIAQRDVDPGKRLILLPIVLHAVGRQQEADEALQAEIDHWANTGSYYVAQTYAYRGDPDRALEWLERAYRQRDPHLIEIVGEPLFDKIANDPRYKAFLRKMKLPDL